MKKITLLLFILNSLTAFSQQSDQLISYYRELKSQGFSEQQIKQMAAENGVNLGSILNTTNNVDQGISKPINPPNTEGLRTNYTSASVKEENTPSNTPELTVFGSQYFKSFKYDFSPQINIATPLDYQLGSGDGVTISLWGASEASYRLNLDTSGTIFIEGVGPIYLNGYTITKAKAKIKKELSKIYSGLTSKVEEEKVFIDLSLNTSRSVFVSIVGQVNAPGLYTLNGMSSAIHALYIAGGISEKGSYRNIEVIRNGKVISIVDLYHYFTTGILPTIFLKDQDVIHVPYYSNRVSLKGEVKLKGIFELKENETLNDLFNYSGGKTPLALENNYLVSSIDIDNSRFKEVRVSNENYELKSGDEVFVYAISNQRDQSVQINGEVLIPGTYSIDGLNTIEDLIKLSKGYTKDAYLEYASLFRTQKDNVTKILSVGLNSSEFNLNLSEPLRERDSLVIYHKNQFLPFSKITIIGNVDKPGEYDYYDSMSLQDLLGLANGIKLPEEKLKIILKTLDQKTNDYILSKVFEDFNLSSFSNTQLKPLDIVNVVEKNVVKPITVKISGEIKNPGSYIQSKKINAIKSLLDEAGGITNFADINSIYIRRSNQTEAFEILSDTLVNNTNLNQDKKYTYIPIVDLDEAYFFEDQDELYIDKFSNDVVISGAIIKPSTVKYTTKRMAYYLNKAGLSSAGSKKNIVVIYPNKDIFSTKRFLFFKNYPKVVPGSEIVVPPKPERAKLTSQEVLGISSGLSTLIIVLSTLLSAQ